MQLCPRSMGEGQIRALVWRRALLSPYLLRWEKSQPLEELWLIVLAFLAELGLDRCSKKDWKDNKLHSLFHPRLSHGEVGVTDMLQVHRQTELLSPEACIFVSQNILEMRDPPQRFRQWSVSLVRKRELFCVRYRGGGKGSLLRLNVLCPLRVVEFVQDA